MIENLFDWIFSTWYNTVLVLFLFFNLLYWITAIAAKNYLARALNRGEVTPLATTPEDPDQRKREIRNSMISIAVFSLQGIILQLGVQQNLLHISYDLSWRSIPQVIILFLWNEIHFYVVHRFLHLPWLRNHVHRVHHHSHEPTVFSTFSFHWIEAFLLGTVIFIPLLIYPFEAMALLSLPVMSIILNTLGHCNYDLFPGAADDNVIKFSSRHSLHHHKGKGNYGFMLSWFDTIFRTAIKRESL